jgi:hypothetical protein
MFRRTRSNRSNRSARNVSGTKETVGLATHDLVLHVDGSEPTKHPEPKKGKKKIVKKKKALPSKSSKSKQLPDARRL